MFVHVVADNRVKLRAMFGILLTMKDKLERPLAEAFRDVALVR